MTKEDTFNAYDFFDTLYELLSRYKIKEQPFDTKITIEMPQSSLDRFRVEINAEGMQELSLDNFEYGPYKISLKSSLK